MKITSCRFERAATKPEDEPRGAGPEVVFLGRSNVGKSSLINRLLGTKDLARTSSTPGRTRAIHFYRVNEEFGFVDLPGYGYAKVSIEERRSWGPMIEGFLRRRRSRLAVAVLIVDARQGPTDLDRTMRDWLVAEGFPYLAVATKADKLSGNGRTRAAIDLAKAMGESASRPPLLVSARTGLGIREIWSGLDRAIDGARTRSKGESCTSAN